MFFVFNKNKVYSYLIAVCTVVMLFFIASVISNDQFNSVETSSQAVENEINLNSIYLEEKGINNNRENILNEEEINIIKSNSNEIIIDKKAK